MRLWDGLYHSIGNLLFQFPQEIQDLLFYGQTVCFALSLEHEMQGDSVPMIILNGGCL
jgi:hypothetical protein